MRATVYKKNDTYKIRIGNKMSGKINNELLALFIFREMTGLDEEQFNASIVEIKEWPVFKLATR